MRLVNPWHDVSFGDDAPQLVRAIVEIPKGSRAKYEIDKASGLLKLDRVLFSSVHYPTHYGIIPQTFCGDKDPLDILILCSVDVEPLTIVESKVVGVMRMVDNDETDDKIIAVAAKDRAVNYINNMADIPPPILEEIRQFFIDYKRLENRKIEVKEFFDRDFACQLIQESFDLYNQEIRPKLG